MISLTLSMGALAQRKGFYAPRTRIIVAPFNYSVGLGFGYPYFGYPIFGYPYGYGFFPYNYMPMSSYSLNRQIAYIRNEYSYKIKAARKDKSVSKVQRKQNILALKSEREKDISNAEQNYRQRRMNYRQGLNNNSNPGINNNQNQGNNNQNQGNNNQNPDNNNNQNPAPNGGQNS